MLRLGLCKVIEHKKGHQEGNLLVVLFSKLPGSSLEAAVEGLFDPARSEDVLVVLEVRCACLACVVLC